VAIAQAEAIAEVVGTCSGDGTATLRLEARREATARAEAVGRASAEVLASSDVCGLCETGLESMISAVENLAVEAVAELNLDVRPRRPRLHVNCSSYVVFASYPAMCTA